MKEQLEKAHKLVQKGYSPLKAVKIAGVKIDEYNNYVSQNETPQRVLGQKIKKEVEIEPKIEEVKEEEKAVEPVAEPKKEVKPKVKKYNKKK